MHKTLTLHALLHKHCTLLTCWRQPLVWLETNNVISLTSINVHQQFDLHGSRPDQNGAASPSVTARVSERFHGYFGGEGAAEFLERSESEAEAHKKLRSSIRTCNWYDDCFLTVVNLFSFCAFFFVYSFDSTIDQFALLMCISVLTSNKNNDSVNFILLLNMAKYD